MSDNCSNYPAAIQRAMECPSSNNVCIDEELGVDATSRRRRSRGHEHERYACPFKFILLALCFVAANSCVEAFSSSASHPSRISNFSRTSSRSNSNSRHERKRRFCMSAVAERPTAKSSTFQSRMKGLMKRNNGGATTSSGRRAVGQRSIDKPSNIKTVSTLEEYKEVLDQEHGKIIVARFFATWCKACKAIQPAYYRMASLYPQIIFLEVPVTNENANLHQGLDVPSLPYGHIYYPQAGLVEELKISRKYFRNLVRLVRWYDQRECNLDEFVAESEDDSSA